MDTTFDRSLGETAAKVSNGMVQLLRKYAGRGPTHARTTIAKDQIVVTLRDTLTTAERTLAISGHAETVLGTRRKLQSIMRDEAVEMVEGLTGRRVIGFMSDNHIDPDLGVEVFITDPVEGELVEGDGLPEDSLTTVY